MKIVPCWQHIGSRWSQSEVTRISLRSWSSKPFTLKSSSPQAQNQHGYQAVQNSSCESTHTCRVYPRNTDIVVPGKLPPWRQLFHFRRPRRLKQRSDRLGTRHMRDLKGSLGQQVANACLSIRNIPKWSQRSHDREAGARGFANHWVEVSTHQHAHDPAQYMKFPPIQLNTVGKVNGRANDVA